jgi:hypothetical protein
MVEQVVGNGQGCAPSTSPVCRCSLPMPVELQVHAACQRRDVTAASAVPAGTTALASVAAEKEGEGLQNAFLASGIDQVFLGSLARGPGWPKADAEGRARCPGRYKLGPNLGQRWVELNTFVRMRRTAGEGARDVPPRSDAFEHAWTRCVGRRCPYGRK